MNSWPALPAELIIDIAAETRRTWLDAAAADGWPQSIDASRVEAVDGAGLQLLLALARSCSDSGGALALRQPSAALRAAIDALGAGAALLPEAAR